VAHVRDAAKYTSGKIPVTLSTPGGGEDRRCVNEVDAIRLREFAREKPEILLVANSNPPSA